MLGLVRVSGSSVLKWSVGNPNSWSRRVVTPFLNWRFFARCVIQWSRAPVKHNGPSRVERKCVMVRNLWKELYSEKCLALAEVDFCFFYAEAMCGHTVLSASVNVSLWLQLAETIDGIFIAWRKNFHHLDCWRGNPLRVSCEAEVESKITLICPWQWSSHWLNSWTANIKRTLIRICPPF